MRKKNKLVDPKIRHEHNKLYRQRHRAGVLISQTKSRATKTGIEFTITESHITPLPVRCPVFDLPLDYTVGNKFRHDLSPSLDRMDNSKGYIPGNVYVISWKANRIKSNANIHDLKKIISYMKKSS